jgi:4-diphosphocytidyl-2-C-methyl-D-erythritol kinase
MTVALGSFAKINLGLYIGPVRGDGFHDLRTVYQTIALHDVVRVTVRPGRGIEILCKDPRVPRDSSNSCYRVAERVMAELGAEGKVTVEIEKRLPVQGGLGGASSNAVATMIALERTLKRPLGGDARLRNAAEVGSDLPLFLVGGMVLGVGRGEEVYPLPDLAATPMVVVTPEVGVSTPLAFAEWDALQRRGEVAELRPAGLPGTALATQARVPAEKGELTHPGASDRLVEVGRALSSWLCGSPYTGAPARGGSRAGSLLLDLVRTGIENDFEKVVFPKHPELRDIKIALEGAGAGYASLSGSGSALYGLFGTRDKAKKAADSLRKQGLNAVPTSMLRRRTYWEKLLVPGC